MIAGCSVARGAESFMFQHIECSVVWSAGEFVAVNVEYLGGAFLVGFAYHHPSHLHALPNSYKWGNVVPMSISLSPAWGIALT